MGFLSGLFGGTKVTQTAQQKTTVNTNVDVTNDIDVQTEEIARVLEEYGLKTTELTEDIKKLIQTASQQNAIDLITQLDFQELIRKRSKQIMYLVAAFMSWWIFFRKKT